MRAYPDPEWTVQYFFTQPLNNKLTSKVLELWARVMLISCGEFSSCYHAPTVQIAQVQWSAVIATSYDDSQSSCVMDPDFMQIIVERAGCNSHGPASHVTTVRQL